MPICLLPYLCQIHVRRWQHCLTIPLLLKADQYYGDSDLYVNQIVAVDWASPLLLVYMVLVLLRLLIPSMLDLLYLELSLILSLDPIFTHLFTSN